MIYLNEKIYKRHIICKIDRHEKLGTRAVKIMRNLLKIKITTNYKYKYKLLISYFLIVATPLIIMTGLLYKISADNMQKEIENSNVYKLNQFKVNLELRIKEMENLASILNVDSKLSPHSIEDSEYKRIEGIKQIGIYKAQNAFINDYHLYFKSSGKVYSLEGQSSIITYVRNFFGLKKSVESSFIKNINELKVPVFLGQEWFEENSTKSIEYISYLYPISFSNYDPYGVVMLHIRKSKLSEMIKNITGHIKGNLLVFDRFGNVLFSESNSFELSSKDINLVKNLINNQNILATGIYEKFYNKDISLLIDTSKNTGLIFALAIPRTQFLEQLVNIKTLIIEAFLIIFSFGILLAIVFSLNVYKPINAVINHITRKWSELGEYYQEEQSNFLDRMSELDRISHTVEIALEQNRNLKERINKQMPFIKEQLLMKLLKGEIFDEINVNNIMELSEVKLDGCSFGVIVIEKMVKSEERLIRVFKDKLLKIIEEESNLKGTVYPVELIQNDAVAAILNLNIKLDEFEKYIDFIKYLKQVIEEATNEKIIIGGGRLYNKIDKINRSFIEAMASLEENKVRRKQGILMFSEIENLRHQIFWYSTHNQLRFLQSLRQGDKIVALESLESIFNDIKENKSSALVIKYICYDIVNMIIKFANEIKIDIFDYNIENVMKFSNIDELERETRLLVEQLCHVVQENKALRKEELNNKIINYINLNFDNVNMSLEKVADEFGLSTYYLSRFFKELTNQTFTDYLIDLRMKKAKELLVNTDLQIKEIVNRIGYTDLTYFMKRFKMTEGVTPGQYRELYRAKYNIGSR